MRKATIVRIGGRVRGNKGWLGEFLVIVRYFCLQ